MRDSKLPAILGAVFALLCIGLGVWFFTTHERVTEDVDVGLHGLAKVNPFLAAERLLEARGIPAETAYAMSEEPDWGTTLVVLSEDLDEREVIFDRLEDWVQMGGHLVVVGVSDGDDVFMRTLYSELELVDADTRTVLTQNPEHGGTWHLQVESADTLHTWGDPYGEHTDVNGRAHALDFYYGSGTITLIADTSPFTNTHLGDHHHASWWLALVQGADQVVLLVRAGNDSLLDVLWRHGWMVFLSAGVLLVVWIAKAAPRFGPPVPDAAPVRRSLMEHVESVGQFHWRQGHIERLVGPTRRAALDRLTRQHPEVARLQGGERVRWVADHTGHSEDLIREALYGHPSNAPIFLQIMATLHGLGRT